MSERLESSVSVNAQPARATARDAKDWQERPSLKAITSTIPGDTCHPIGSTVSEYRPQGHSIAYREFIPRGERVILTLGVL